MPAAEWAGAAGPCAPGRASPWGANAMGLTPNLTLLFALVPEVQCADFNAWTLSI